jgi:hypothetical protein
MTDLTKIWNTLEKIGADRRKKVNVQKALLSNLDRKTPLTATAVKLVWMCDMLGKLHSHIHTRPIESKEGIKDVLLNIAELRLRLNEVAELGEDFILDEPKEGK